MDITEFQEKVSDILIRQEYSKIDISVTDNRRAVIIELPGSDAAYTANETRRLANSIDQFSHTKDQTPQNLIVYLHQMAALVEGNIQIDNIKSEWTELKAAEEDIAEIHQGVYFDKFN